MDTITVAHLQLQVVNCSPVSREHLEFFCLSYVLYTDCKSNTGQVFIVHRLKYKYKMYSFVV